jgi:hypothetical protein
MKMKMLVIAIGVNGLCSDILLQQEAKKYISLCENERNDLDKNSFGFIVTFDG